MMAGKGDGRDHSIIPENIRRKSRFGLMMEMVRGGCTPEQLAEAFKGADLGVFNVLTSINNDTVSAGSDELKYEFGSRARGNFEEHLRQIYRLFDDGMSTREVAVSAGIAYGTAVYYRTLWGHERGISTRVRN